MKYVAELVNKSGCTFDKSEFNSKKAAHSWASGRGGCKLVLQKQNDNGELIVVAEFNKK